MNDYIYIIIYDKVSISNEGYDSLEKAKARLITQGYKQFYELIYCTDKSSARIKEIKII